jgi:MoaE-MoaD fusion protein
MNEPGVKEITVHVLFFGAARDAARANLLEISLPPAATVAGAFEYLVVSFPDLKRFGRSLLFAVNQEYAAQDKLLQEGDEMAIFPPVSGGAQSNEEMKVEGGIEATEQASACDYRCPVDFFELTTEAIDVGEVARRIVLPECGATVTLDGYARGWTAGRQTQYLIYEAYAPMALTEMQGLGGEVHKRFEIAHVGIVHRTGRLEIGETSVVISVSAPHRGAAFEACEWAIRELKRTVPIWKKEVFEDGEVWVEGESQRGTEGTSQRGTEDTK